MKTTLLALVLLLLASAFFLRDVAAQFSSGAPPAITANR